MKGIKIAKFIESRKVKYINSNEGKLNIDNVLYAKNTILHGIINLKKIKKKKHEKNVRRAKKGC